MNIDPLTCRACLGSINDLKTNSRQKEASFEDHRMISSMFQSVTGYFIQGSEPQNFCKRCREELTISFRFRERCDKTQKILKSHLTDLKPVVPGVPGISEVIKIEPYESLLNVETGISGKVNEENPIERSRITSAPKDTLLKLEDDHGFSPDDDDKDFNEPETQMNSDSDADCTIFPTFSDFGTNCSLCNKKLNSKNALYHHLTTIHPKTMTKPCPGCQKLQFPQFYDDHIEKCAKLAKQQPIVCSQCGEMVSQNHYNKHLKNVHSTPDIYQCDLCGAKVKSRSSISSHMKNVHLPTVWRCTICLLVLKSNSSLLTHRRAAHPEKYKKLSCKYCYYQTASSSNLRVHTLAHIGEAGKRFQCSFCEMRFSQKRPLMFHEATHSELRPHTCETCGKSYKTRKALLAHAKSHREYQYECPVCGRAFFTNQLMRNHCMKGHPDYQLPPPGTVMNKNALESFKRKGQEVPKFVPLASR